MTIEETIDKLRNQFAIMEDARAAVPRNALGIDQAHSKWASEQITLEVMLRQAWPKIDAALSERERLRVALEFAKDRLSHKEPWDVADFELDLAILTALAPTAGQSLLVERLRKSIGGMSESAAARSVEYQELREAHQELGRRFNALALADAEKAERIAELEVSKGKG